MNYSPIVLFTYNRPDTTEATIEALAQNPEAVHSELYIFSDAPKSEMQIDNVNAVRELIKSMDHSRFKRVHVRYQEKNKGLAASIIDGVSEVIEKHAQVIVLEDDCVTSPCFLKYMNKALAKYENNSNIGSISGFTPELENLPDSDVYAVMRSCSLGWGTWKSRWDKVDFNMGDYSKWRYNFRFINNLNKCGNDRMYRLIRQKKYKLQSWSIRFGAYLAAEGLLTVYPKYSYIENIGLESGGVHSSQDVSTAMKTKNSNGIENPVFPENLSEDMNIAREFRRVYAGSIIQQIKRTLYVFGGEVIIDAIRGKK